MSTEKGKNKGTKDANFNDVDNFFLQTFSENLKQHYSNEDFNAPEVLEKFESMYDDNMTLLTFILLANSYGAVPNITPDTVSDISGNFLNLMQVLRKSIDSTRFEFNMPKEA